MLNLPGIKIIAQIYESVNSLVDREIRLEDNLRGFYPSQTLTLKTIFWVSESVERSRKLKSSED